jgi:hypothetical protein
MTAVNYVTVGKSYTTLASASRRELVTAARKNIGKYSTLSPMDDYENENQHIRQKIAQFSHSSLPK